MRSRSVIGVNDSGARVIHQIAAEKGSKGLMIARKNGRFQIRISDKNGQLLKNTEEFTGIKHFSRKGNLLWEQDMKE